MKTVRFEEHTMPKDKYPSIFGRQMEATVFIILNFFFVAVRAVLKFSHMACLDQSCAGENI